MGQQGGGVSDASSNTNNKAPMTPVRVVIVKGAAEVTIKVSDQGGGIPRSTMTRIFTFTHSTARQEYEGNTDFATVEAGIQHMRGFGLPLARIYARYFGGELTLKSMEGYGLDAYLYLPRLGDACENLPRRVIASPGEQVSLPSPATTTRTCNNNNKTKASSSSSSRAFSTLAKPSPPAVLLQSAWSATNQPCVMDTKELFDPTSWEEDKMRRVLKMLSARAL
jgi:Histidine kinase-, DNA gyrase B-, and HSP90-like ATPase